MAHAIALLNADAANAEMVADIMREIYRTVARMRRQHGVEPETITVLH
jgi:hypothetical protein